MSLSPKNHCSYDKIARAWTDLRNRSFVSNLVMDFAGKVRPNGQILDIGCGSGYLSKYLAERNFQVKGIDASAKMIEIARSQKIPNTDFINVDFFDFLSPHTFDGVMAWDSFFHFPKSKQQDIYLKIGSLLNINGYLLFTHGDADDEHVDTMMGEPFYYSCLPRKKVTDLLMDAGFEIQYGYTNFVEQHTDRSLIILAKKMR